MAASKELNANRLKFVKKWIKRLRSGQDKQTTGFLHDKDGAFCCLGVACDIAVKDGLFKGRIGTSEPGNITYGAHYYNDKVLPRTMVNLLGLKDESGLLYYTAGYDSLANANDSGATFLEIADLIEKNLKTNKDKLFKQSFVKTKKG